jgi:hypothetical protein
MTSFAHKLLAASRNKSLSEADLRVWMRRATIKIDNPPVDRRSIVIDPEILKLVEQIAASSMIDRATAVNALLRDWLITHQLMPPELLKDIKTKGSA